MGRIGGRGSRGFGRGELGKAAEVWEAGCFDVFCNFRPLLERFDILGSTEPPNVARKTFHGLVPDGQGRLIFNFVPRENRAMVNAIEVFAQ
ncbi:MAG: hypothetical protein ABI972_05655 [Acidobacteriota bacterium]